MRIRNRDVLKKIRQKRAGELGILPLADIDKMWKDMVKHAIPLDSMIVTFEHGGRLYRGVAHCIGEVE